MSILSNHTPVVHYLLSRVHPQTPGIRMAQVRRLLQSHAHLLQTQGTAAYVVHRREIGAKPDNFLQSVRRVLHGTGTAHWWQPWPRGAVSNVLVVRVSRGGAGAAGEGQADGRA